MKDNIYFKRAMNTADLMVKEQERVKEILTQALDKAKQKRNQIREVFGDIQDLITLVKFYFKGEYTKIPWRFIILALAAIIYFVNPMDLIPDIIPAMGFMDDATIVALVINAMKDEIDDFRKYQMIRNPAGN
ncbi:MAG: YkvA family protein [Calditrichia bacterium]